MSCERAQRKQCWPASWTNETRSEDFADSTAERLTGTFLSAIQKFTRVRFTEGRAKYTRARGDRSAGEAVNP